MEEKKSISVGEIIEQEKLLEEEAQHQLEEYGEDNEDTCKYDQGYITQRVFACETCYIENGSKQRVGVCYGCSMTCHVQHKIYELFKKRNFRCDCGTPSSRTTCLIKTEKIPEDNSKNHYNHNFDGKYCWCDGLEDFESVMYQCELCCEWFHIECIRNKEERPVPDPDTPCDFVCVDCMQRGSSFIPHYIQDFLLPDSLPVGVSPSSQKEEEVDGKCQMETRERVKEEEWKKVKNGFWKKGWRKHLCTCESCNAKYDEAKMDFVTDPKDMEDKENEEQDSEEEDEPIENQTRKRKIQSLLESSQEAFLQSKDMSNSQKRELVRGFENYSSALTQALKQLYETKPHNEEVTEKVRRRRRMELKGCRR
ncbi:putative E3 ubiquitin-protein ligase UBR7-like [Planoprotostelium fungivorum]|uniref:Putative E3 ubiquitin-protein ligase UBR7-like n=1 Tax=Planoprotostelium fungivorum TaxID=1890364 RepID=A0A2P6P003_9EUKA|nr:putative E3 ubiquitin-protein ligase UBR7-like [Planoprotostelium fungivorum]